MTRIVIVGDVMWDVVVRPHAPVATGSDTASAIAVSRGGAAANLAVALRAALHQPADVTYVGCRGDDAMGQRFAEELNRANIEPWLRTSSKATGTLVSMVDASGERSMFTDRGANQDLLLDDADAVLDDARHLHLSGYTLLHAGEQSWVSGLLLAAQARGVTTSVDACSWRPLQHFGSERFLTAVQGVDVLFANADEARLLSGTDDLEAAIASLASSASEVVVTNGSQGASVWRDGVIEHVASIAVDVVDTTGAGDATAGTYLAWRLDGHDVGAALRAAMVAAARVVATIGSGDGSR